MILPDCQVVEHGRLVKVGHAREIIFPDEYVRIPEMWKISFALDVQGDFLEVLLGLQEELFPIGRIVLNDVGGFPHAGGIFDPDASAL